MSIYNELADEIARQDTIHPDGYPATRDGIRLAIAVHRLTRLIVAERRALREVADVQS